MDSRDMMDAADPDGTYSGKRMSRKYKERFYVVRYQCQIQPDIGLML